MKDVKNNKLNKTSRVNPKKRKARASDDADYSSTVTHHHHQEVEEENNEDGSDRVVEVAVGEPNNNDTQSDAESETMPKKKAKTDDTIRSINNNNNNNISSADGGEEPAKVASSEKNDDEPLDDSHGGGNEDTTTTKDPHPSPLPQKRRKKPSEKLRMQQEVMMQDESLMIMEDDEPPNNNNNTESHHRPRRRRQSSRNRTVVQKTTTTTTTTTSSTDNTGTRYKKKRLKKLDPEEEQLVLERARQKGLPEGWKVAYHKDWKRKIWISPDDSRICDTVPRAIAIWNKMLQDVDIVVDSNNNNNNDAEDMDQDGNNIAGKKGDDDDDDDDHDDDDDEEEKEGVFKVANSFVTLKKKTGLLGTDPASKLISTSEDLFEMSDRLEQAALKKGKNKGLRQEGWRCVWNSKFRRKNWVSPQGRLFGNLSRAVEKQDDWILKQEKKKMKANKKLQEAEEEWQKQLKRLIKYKRRHGDTLVPDNYERYVELPFWVRKQRREYARLQSGMKSHITTEQIEQLNRAGFQWVVQKVPKQRASTKNKQAATSSNQPHQPKSPKKEASTALSAPPPEGSIFDNAPEEMFTRRHVLFSDMQPPPVASPRVPIQFVNPIRKLPNGSLGTESYCKEVEQYLKTWYGADGQAS